MSDVPGAGGSTLIGTDTTINGEVTFSNAVKILGRVEGKIAGKGDLHIGEGATCKATIEAKKVSIDGNVEGNVAGLERTILNAKAKLQGDLVSPKLVIEEGASFVGHCTVGPDAANGRPVSAAEPKPNLKDESAPKK